MNTELTNEQSEELAGMVKAECRHEGEKRVGYDEVTCRDCGWITPSGQHMGPHNGWFPSHDAHKQFKKYGTYPGMDEARSINRNAAPTPPSAPVQQSVREAFEAHQLRRYQYSDVARHTDGRYLNAFMESEWETWQAALSASPAGDKVEGEPVAWAVFSDNGNIRLWSANKSTVERFADENEKPAAPLYTHPQPDSNELGGGEK
jgi:hypothetical protein